MKPTLLALASLGLGIAIGLAITRREFARDVLPAGPAATPVGVSVKPKAAGEAKAVVVNGELHEFGVMNRGATGEHVFVIRNEGTASLKLTAGKTTCKCTSFEVVKTTLAPGEETDAKLQWKPEIAQDHFEQSAEVFLEHDPSRQVVLLVISGRVIDLVRPERWEILLTDASASETAHVRLKIFAYLGDKLAIDRHEWLNPTHAQYFHVRSEPLTAEELAADPNATAGVALLLDVDQGLPLGPLDETLRLTTNLPEVQPLEIRVRGNVVSDLLLAGPRVIPEKLLVSIGPVSRQEGIKTTVFLLVKGPHRAETKLAVAAVEPASEFHATLGDPDSSSPKVVRYPLTIEIPAGATPVARGSEGSYAQIKLASTHPQVKELTVRVRYIVKE